MKNIVSGENLSPDLVDTLYERKPDLDKEYLALISALDDELTSLKERYSLKYEELFGEKELAREQLEIDMVSLL